MTPASPRVVRTAAVFLIAFALIELATFAAVSRVGSSFNERSAMHVDAEVQRVRTQIAAIESTLEASAARVSNQLGRSSVLTRPQLFRLLQTEVKHAPGRGMRIVGSDGHLLDRKSVV